MSVTSYNPKCYYKMQAGKKDKGTTLSWIVKCLHFILPFVLAHTHTDTCAESSSAADVLI